jgi:hypothetical protein
MLTFGYVPYFFVRSCHFVRLAPCRSHCKRKRKAMIDHIYLPSLT